MSPLCHPGEDICEKERKKRGVGAYEHVDGMLLGHTLFSDFWGTCPTRLNENNTTGPDLDGQTAEDSDLDSPRREIMGYPINNGASELPLGANVATTKH